jgi:hypothetical protein
MDKTPETEQRFRRFKNTPQAGVPRRQRDASKKPGNGANERSFHGFFQQGLPGPQGQHGAGYLYRIKEGSMV